MKCDRCNVQRVPITEKVGPKNYPYLGWRCNSCGSYAYEDIPEFIMDVARQRKELSYNRGYDNLKEKQ